MASNRPTSNDLANYRKFFRDFPNFSIELTKHARTRMEQRNIRLPQMRTVLMTGSILPVEPDIRTGRDKYRVFGRDADGRSLEVVATLKQVGLGCVVIVTVIDRG